MMMLARQLGYVQLGEPMRFRAGWEREASLRLRAGDVSVLTEYNQQGRLRYGTREEMTEAAYQHWLADYLEGKHSALIAHDQADADEMSRRARGDLKRYGRVASAGEVPLRQGAVASAGDRIMARENGHQQPVGVPGRGLSNRDVLEVLRTDAGAGRDVEVRLLLGRDSEGTERWGAPFRLSRRYLAAHCHLAYGLTVHSVEGSTFADGSYSLIRPSDSRKTLYTAMTRGREQNIAFVAGEPAPPDAPDATTAAPERPAEADPEVARFRALERERAGELVAGPEGPGPDGDAVSALAQVIRRDDTDLAVGETLRKAYSDADHLADIGLRWTELAKEEQRERWGQVLRDTLPEHLAAEALDDAAVTWLFRELRGAELAGLDGAAVLAEAVDMRPLTGIRDAARVLHGRVRILTRDAQIQVGRTWAERTPAAADPGRQRYLADLAEAIDARVQRLGEHAAETAPLWATRALGPVPDDPAARAEWQERASVVAAYREMHGYDNPGDPIGPQPSKASPEARADWHSALVALGRVDGMDLMGVPDEVLEVRRGLYERETAWAPEHVGDQLRLARMTVTDARERELRAEHEERSARTEEARRRHAENRAIWAAAKAKAYAELSAYEKGDLARREHARVTEAAKRAALAGDLELRRRHPERVREPLRSAEPENTLARAQGHAEPARQEPLPGMPAATAEPEVLTGRQEDQRMLTDLGLTPQTAADPVPEHVLRVAENAREAEELLATIRSMPEPAGDPDEMSPGEAWAVAAGRQRDSVLQPAERMVEPAPKLAGPERGAEPEAAP